MKLAIIALTESGRTLAKSLGEKLEEAEIYLPVKLAEGEDIHSFDTTLRELVAKLFEEYDALVFIMALGIVVRVIAPYLADKRRDPAVVTIDETGQNVISTLSGHLGGANGLTEKIATLIGANPVISTATDCHGKLAIDLLAQRLDCEIIPFENLKLANSAIVNDKTLNIFTDYHLELDEDENINLYPLKELGQREGFPVIITNKAIDFSAEYLQLVPKNIILGIGCRKGISVTEVEDAISYALEKLQLRRESIKALATVDLKKKEIGIVEAANSLEVPLNIISRAEIKRVDFEYTSSEFVKEKIGVGGVCEPVAVLSAKNSQLLLPKTIRGRVTVAVVEESFM
jgi:cobalt-precorrin 5A hydrolase